MTCGKTNSRYYCHSSCTVCSGTAIKCQKCYHYPCESPLATRDDASSSSKATASPSKKPRLSDDSKEVVLLSEVSAQTKVFEDYAMFRHIAGFCRDTWKMNMSIVSPLWNTNTKDLPFTSVYNFGKCIRPSPHFKYERVVVDSWEGLFFSHAFVTDLTFVTRQPFFDRVFFREFPRLKKLKLGFVGPTTISYLPPALESLEYGKYVEVTLSRKLTLPNIRRFVSPAVVFNVTSVDSAIDSSRPLSVIGPNLRILKIQVREWAHLFAWNLPDRLETLEMWCNEKLGVVPDGWYPASLKSIEIHSREAPAVLFIPDQVDSLEIGGVDFPRLSRWPRIVRTTNNNIDYTTVDLKEGVEEIYVFRAWASEFINFLDRLPQSVRYLNYCGRHFDLATRRFYDKRDERIGPPIVPRCTMKLVGFDSGLLPE
jgi:hypothetical protein